MKLYTHPVSSNCRKVKAVVEHLGLPVEHCAVDLLSGEHKKPAFLAVNPNGKVPALVDGELQLWESNAIMAYLASKKDTPLWPKSNVRYDIMRWFNWEAAHLSKCVHVLVYEHLLKPMMNQGQPDKQHVDAARADFGRFGSVLDGWLADRSYLAGGTLTLADFAVAATLTFAEQAQLPLQDYPQISRWNASLDEIPAWRNTLPQLG